MFMAGHVVGRRGYHGGAGPDPHIGGLAEHQIGEESGYRQPQIFYRLDDGGFGMNERANQAVGREASRNGKQKQSGCVIPAWGDPPEGVRRQANSRNIGGYGPPCSH